MDSKDQNLDLTRTKRIHLCPFQFIFVCWVYPDSKFNSFHSRLKFTMEVGDSQLNFLVLTVIIRNSFMIFDWYQKPTFSGRILNYFSQHPITQKRGVIMNLIDKVFLSHYDFQQKNFSLLFLLDNSYPLHFLLY